MIESPLTPLVDWLTDVYLLSTVLLLVGLALMHRYKQPSRRMAVARAVVAGAGIIGVLTAMPGWPRTGTIGWLPGDSARTPSNVTASAAAEPVATAARVHDPIGSMPFWAGSLIGRRTGVMASTALGLWERPSMLHRRVRVLLDPELRVEPATSRRWRTGVVCLGLLCSLLLSLVTRSPSAAITQDMRAQKGEKGPAMAASQKADAIGGRFQYAGRVLDPDGKPVAGATIHHRGILETERGDLSEWITASTAGAGGSYEIESQFLKHKLWPQASGLEVAITSDVQGRFSISGVGRERLIVLKVSGPTIQTKEIRVLTRPVAPFQVNQGRGSADWGIALYYGTSFTHAAAPTKPVIGLVKDRETGEPLTGVKIASVRTAEFPVHGFNGIETTSDAQGRYSLVGLPKRRGNHVEATPSKGQPYLAAGVDIPDTPGLGTYRVVGLPGRGLIAAMHTEAGKQYLIGPGPSQDPSMAHTLPVVPDGMLGYFNALAEVDPPKNAAAYHRDIALVSGTTRTVRIVDPDGRPLAGARVKLSPTVANLSEPQPAAEFQAQALWPKEVRPLVAFHDRLKLAGSIEVHAEQEGILEFELQPWGTIVGRLVDDDGVPRAGVHIIYDERHDDEVVTDSQGRFQVEGLLPEKPARVWVSPLGGFFSGTVAKPLVLKPGETKQLGDVREDKS